MHPFGAVVVESDHRLNGDARRISANEPDIAPHRLDVVEHPGFVALLFLDALVELVAYVAEPIVATRDGGRHDRAEMPHDVIEVVQERAVFLDLQSIVDERVHLRHVLQLASAGVGQLDKRDEE